MIKGRHRATEAEIEVRRAQVLRFRFARLTEPEIAKKLEVSAATVSRDLQAIRESWGERLGPKFDARQELSETLGLYDLLEGAAIKELVRLEDEQSEATASKMRCIRTARGIRAARLELLGAVGLIGAAPLSSNRLPMASELFERLAAIRAADLVEPPPPAPRC